MLFLRQGDENGSGGTLSGNKKDVYICLKLSKILHGVSVTSFSLKFAVDRGLPDRKEESEPIGKLLKKVLRYYTIKDKLQGVNSKLAEIGVKDIRFDFETNKIGFIFENGKFIIFFNLVKLH